MRGKTDYTKRIPQFREIICEWCKNCIGGYYVESVWEENDENTFKLLHPVCLKCLVSPEFDAMRLGVK